MYRKTNQQNRQNDEFQEVAPSANMRNTAEYHLFAKYNHDLVKDFVNNIIKVAKSIDLA
jgi:hypothetical protein